MGESRSQSQGPRVTETCTWSLCSRNKTKTSHSTQEPQGDSMEPEDLAIRRPPYPAPAMRQHPHPHPAP
ncbi:hypothetical protein FQN60_007985 [Etheostoma spectabile]|uniref:Uncharacterized protein n=1 Tax=Etheostoma spectabile TaxID=54343 RepID=A0A5J5CUI9_9PERO|nr:hypothetical protein FQN60_007985 [Etheostoma spectabile]